MNGGLSRRCLGAVLASLVLWSRPAVAQWAVGLDAGQVDGGGGAAVGGRFGYRTGPPRAYIIHTIILEFELAGGAARLGPWTDDRLVGHFGAGGRIGFPAGGLLDGLLDEAFDGWSQGWLGKPISDFIGTIEPFAFAHFGAADSRADWGTLGDWGLQADFRLATCSLGAYWKRDYLQVPNGSQQFGELGFSLEARGFWF